MFEKVMEFGRPGLSNLKIFWESITGGLEPIPNLKLKNPNRLESSWSWAGNSTQSWSSRPNPNRLYKKYEK